MTHNIKHILVAVDRFPQSRPALARALELGRLHAAKVTIVHICAEIGALVPDMDSKHLIEEQGLQLARERIESSVRVHDPDMHEVDVRISAGSASAGVVTIAKELDVDLIVLRAHQRRSIKEKLLGSTADQIIRATPVSVLIVKRPAERDYRRAVVAVDFSAASESAAILSTKICAGIDLQLVHFFHVSAQFLQSMLQAGTSSKKIDAFRRTLADNSHERMRHLLKRLDGRQPAPRCKVVESEPASSIVKLTRNRAVDLIAVGPFEHGAIRLALLGSVTQRLLREADCDVLISRPHKLGLTESSGGRLAASGH